MKVKVIRGSVQYDGTIYGEGMEVDVRSEDFAGLAEVVEALEGAEAKEETEEKSVPEGSDQNETVNYKTMKKEELLEVANQKGVEVPSGAKKDEIITLLEEADSNE